MNKVEFKDVKITDLVVDSRVQRPREPTLIRNIANNFRWPAFGVPCVSRREDGTLVLLDGQQRVEAAKLAGHGNSSVRCEIHSGMTLAEEAAMFHWRNNSAQVKFLDKFRVRLTEGDESALAVVDLISKYGWAMPGHGSPEIFCIQTMESLNKRNPVVAEQTLAIVTRAWGHDENGVDTRVVGGLGAFLNRHFKDVDLNSLREKLSSFQGGPTALVGKARGLRDMVGSSVTSSVAEVITEMYNKHRRNRLSNWRS